MFSTIFSILMHDWCYYHTCSQILIFLADVIAYDIVVIAVLLADVIANIWHIILIYADAIAIFSQLADIIAFVVDVNHIWHM